MTETQSVLTSVISVTVNVFENHMRCGMHEV